MMIDIIITKQLLYDDGYHHKKKILYDDRYHHKKEFVMMIDAIIKKMMIDIIIKSMIV